MIETLLLAVTLLQPLEIQNVKLTGYCAEPPCVSPKWADGKTATGTPARRGVCAANWDSIKPGMVFDVPGYGRCRVEDNGNPNFVRGIHLDLFFDSAQEGRNWGVRHHTIRLIEVPDNYKPMIFGGNNEHP
jgi:3D (Asp-Asp-Asp) domain-containing protein